MAESEERETKLRSRIAHASTPAQAILAYEDALSGASSPMIVDRLRDRFGPLIDIFRAALKISGGSWLPFLDLYARTRRADQRRMLTAAVSQLIALGLAAEENDRAVLDSLGRAFPSLVLDGTAEQRFCCDLALRLAAAPALPPSLVEMIVRPLILALRTVLSLGAPRTVMLAIEATGALLKLVPYPAAEFPPFDTPARVLDLREHAAYMRKVERDRRMVLAIAGDPEVRNQYFGALHRLLENADAERSVDGAEAEILERIELLRVLPAFIRQNGGEWQ